MNEDIVFVAKGDYISLFCVDTKGYVFSNDVSDVQNGVFIHTEQDLQKPEGILDSSMCKFRIGIQNRYKLARKYRKLLKEQENMAERADDPDILNQLKLAKKAAEEEKKDNVAEAKRIKNQKLVYGEIIQLEHTWSGKYVHVSTVTGSIKDQDNMLVYLSEVNSKSGQFRVLPRYKVKSVGDAIQPLDHVMFESVKMPGHYLHASHPWQINGFSFGSELNLGLNKSSFIMSVIRRPTADDVDLLRFGDSIQLYHRELESHLLLQGGFNETPKSDALFFEVQDFTTNSLHLVSESGLKFWTIEDSDGIVNARPIRWGQSVLVRHRITHRYLILDEAMNVSTTNSCNDPRAVFALHPVKKGKDMIIKNSLGRIQHQLTGYWLRTLVIKQSDSEDDLAIKEDDVIHDNVQNTALAATEQEQYHDAFMLLSVSREDVLRFNYLAGVVPFFATFTHELMKKGVMRQTDKNILVMMLSELHKQFQSESGSEHMEVLMRNFKLVDLLLALMKFPPPSKHVERQMVYDVILASYSVMQIYLSGKARENAEYLVKDMQFFYKQLENRNSMLAMNAALTLTAMLTDNRLVLDELEDRNILYIVDLVKRNKNPLHLDILAATCICEGRGSMKNQIFMAENLIDVSDCPLYRFSFGSDCDQVEPNEVYISRCDEKWEKLVDFVQAGVSGNRPEDYSFLLKQLHLMERISHGSNTQVIKLILKGKQLINWKLMFECLMKTTLPGDVRAAFCRLIQGLCVLDGTGVWATDTMSLSFEFDLVGRYDPIQRKVVDKDDEDQGEAIKIQAFVPLRKFVLEFLEGNAVLDCSNAPQNKLVMEVVRLADAMLNYGYFGGRDDLQQLISAVVAILDGRTDIPRQLEKKKKGYVKKEMEILNNYRNSERFTMCQQNTSLVEVKTGCLKILDTVFTYQYHAALHALINKFKIIHTSAWVPKVMIGSMLTREVDLENRKDAPYVQLLEEKLDDIFRSSYFFQVRLLTDVLFDISNYQYQDVMIKSIGLLNRLYTSDEKLFQRGAESQVLLTEASRRVYNQAQELVPLIRLLTAGVLDDNSARRASRAVHEIIKSCTLEEQLDLSHPINQRIFINHGILSALYDLLNQYATDDLRRLSRHMIKLLRRTLVLLAALCNRCPQAQKRTYEEIDIILKYKLLGEDVGLCLEKMFYGNEQLCLSVPAEKIQQIVNLAGSRREKAGAILGALRHVIQIESQKLIIPRNQEIVMKAIMHNFHNVAYVLDKPFETKVQILLGKYGNQHRHYLLMLVSLLATAAEGENILNESLCQKYISLDETMTILNNDEIEWHYKEPYLRFLDSAYMNTISSPSETGASELAHSSATWDFMERIMRNIDDILTRLRGRKEIIDSLLNTITSISHVADRNDRSELLKYDLRVYFNAIIPFLQRFMTKFFDRDDANFPEEIKILDKLTKKSLEFAEEIRFCIANQNFMQKLITGVTCVASRSTLPCRDVLDFLEKVNNMTSMKSDRNDSAAEVEYAQYYQTENELNEALSMFNKNLVTVYCGLNTVMSQIGPYFNRHIPHKLARKQYTSESEALPLGPEFQQFVMVHIDPDGKTPEERYRRAIKLLDVMRLSHRQVRDEITRRVEQTNVRCLQILRAILHNEILFLSDSWDDDDSQMNTIRDIQNLFVNSELFKKIQWLMGCPNPQVANEVLTFFSKVFFNANRVAQAALMSYFKNSTEETFFEVATNIINSAEYQIREIRSLHLQKEKQKCQTHDPTFSDYLQEQIRFFSPHDKTSVVNKERKRIRWWYTKKRKDAIRQQRALQAAAMVNGDQIEMQTYQNFDPPESVSGTGTGTEPEYSEVMGTVSMILVLVGQACDGQNKVIQDYMREQLDNVKSFNLISCIGQLLASIYTTFGRNTIELITRIMDTMNELSTGNQNNQRVIQQSKIVDQLNFILRSGLISQCGEDQGIECLEIMVKLLRTITEENDPDTLERTESIAHSLDTNSIVKLFTECYACCASDALAKIPKGQETDWSSPLLPTLDVHEKEMEDRVLKLGFHAYFLVQRLMEKNKSMNVEEFCVESRIAWNYYEKKSMSVELVKDDFVNKVYFRVDDEAILRTDVIEQIRWDMDRSSYNCKIRDLMSWRRGILQDMRYQRKLMRSRFVHLFMKSWKFLVYTNLFVSVFISVTILYDYKPLVTIDLVKNLTELPPELFGTGFQPLDFGFLYDSGHVLAKVVFGLAILHVVTAFMVVISYFLRNQPNFPDVRNFIERIKKRFYRPAPGEIKSKERDEVEEKSLGTPVFGFTTLYYLLFMGCSLAGLLVNDFFFSFHLFNIISINQILKRVIRAVTQNGLSLLWVTILGLAVLFAYTLIIYASFRAIMDPGENWWCNTMYQCYVTVIRYGLIGDMLDSMPIPDQEKTFDRFIWYAILNVSFFVLITTIGLNIIFGIIVDTFSELRDLKWTAEKDMNEVCTICDIEHYEFDNKSNGFWYHVNKEHNIWWYMFYFLYLSETKMTDFTSIELFVHNQLESKQTEFFPFGKALSLMEVETKDEDKLEALSKQVQELMDRQRARDEEDRLRREEERRRTWEEKNKPIYTTLPKNVR